MRKRVRIGLVLVLALSALAACSDSPDRTASWLPLGAPATATTRGLHWLRTHPDPGGAGLTELASVLDAVDRQAGRPKDLTWIRPVVRRAREQAGRDADPQGRALARLLGASTAPVSPPAETGANTVTKLVTMALWCRTYPVPAGFDSALASARDATVITVVAAAGASELLLVQGCRAPRPQAGLRRVLAASLVGWVRRLPVGDASLQAAAMLFGLDRADLIPKDWTRRVLRAQRRDGSWPAGTAPGSSREAWRATAWAVRALAARQLDHRSDPGMLAAGIRRTPVSRARSESGAAPDRPAGILRAEDQQALRALGVHDPRPLTEPQGGTPFGSHADHHDRVKSPDDPTVAATLARELVDARDAAVGLETINDAIQHGYVRGSAFIPAAGAHWIKWDLVDRPFDPARPSMLLFDGDGSDARVVGFSYVLRSVGHPPDGFAGNADQWHQHFAICFANGRLVGSDILSTGDCAVLGRMTSKVPAAVVTDLLAGDDLWMLHAWIVPGRPNRDGVFTSSNPSVQCAACPPWLAGNELG